MILKQSTAFTRTFSFVGLSLTSLSVTISKAGGAFGAIAGTLSQITGSFYKIALATGDVDTLGCLAYKFSDTVLGVVVPNGDDVDQVGSPQVVLDLTQAVPTSNTAETVGDALNAARADGFGKWIMDANAKTLVLYANDGTTVVRTFTLDSGTAPLTRT